MDLGEFNPDEMPSLEQVQQQQQMKAQHEEQRSSILDQILETETKDRIKRLAIVNEAKAKRIEDSLIQAATSGQLRQKVSEKTLIEMIDNIDDQKQKKVTIQRRRYEEDESDNDDDLL